MLQVAKRLLLVLCASTVALAMVSCSKVADGTSNRDNAEKAQSYVPPSRCSDDFSKREKIPEDSRHQLGEAELMETAKRANAGDGLAAHRITVHILMAEGQPDWKLADCYFAISALRSPHWEHRNYAQTTLIRSIDVDGDSGNPCPRRLFWYQRLMDEAKSEENSAEARESFLSYADEVKQQIADCQKGE